MMQDYQKIPSNGNKQKNPTDLFSKSSYDYSPFYEGFFGEL